MYGLTKFCLQMVVCDYDPYLILIIFLWRILINFWFGSCRISGYDRLSVKNIESVF